MYQNNHSLPSDRPLNLVEEAEAEMQMRRTPSGLLLPVIDSKQISVDQADLIINLNKRPTNNASQTSKNKQFKQKEKARVTKKDSGFNMY